MNPRMAMTQMPADQMMQRNQMREAIDEQETP